MLSYITVYFILKLEGSSFRLILSRTENSYEEDILNAYRDIMPKKYYKI